jgi:hypothetical protein
MRRALPVLLLLLCCGPSVAQEPIAKGLVVHEWGVWRVHNDGDLANADLAAIWNGLPKFLYGQMAGRELPKHWPNLEPADRPILFFYSPTPVELELRIDFPGGHPMVWWPGTLEPANHLGRGQQPQQPAELSRHLLWRFRVKTPPPGRPERALAPVEKDHWVQTIRDVGADSVHAYVGEQRFGSEQEKFIYYDGLLPRGDWVRPTVEKDRVRLTSRASHPVFDVTVVDRRTPNKVRVARLARLDAGTKDAVLELTDIEEATWRKEGEATLRRQLTDAGLSEPEARSLIALWKAELLDAGGVTLFYRLPQEEYERCLPLKMTPRPEKLVRVGLVHHGYLDPDLAERIARLVKDLDNEDFQVRERAQKQLEGLGRAAYVHLVRLRKETKDPETQRRIDAVLAKLDAVRLP